MSTPTTTRRVIAALLPLAALPFLTGCTPASGSLAPVPEPPTAACFPVDGTGNWLQPQCTALAVHWASYSECRSAVWREMYDWHKEEIDAYFDAHPDHVIWMGGNLCLSRQPTS